MIDTNLVVQILSYICEDSPKDFYRYSLVSKVWQKANDEIYQRYYQKIAPELFGRAAYVKHIGGDPGEEPKIPFEFFLKYKSGSTLLTLIPMSLRFTRPKKRIVEDLCTLQNMGKWAAHPQEGNIIRYHEFSKIWLNHRLTKKYELESILEGEMYWSFRVVAPAGHGQFLPQLVVRKGDTWSMSKVSKTSDTILSLFMAYVKTGVLLLAESDPPLCYAN